jgi:hypothetical protein
MFHIYASVKHCCCKALSKNNYSRRKSYWIHYLEQSVLVSLAVELIPPHLWLWPAVSVTVIKCEDCYFIKSILYV